MYFITGDDRIKWALGFTLELFERIDAIFVKKTGESVLILKKNVLKFCLGTVCICKDAVGL